MLIIKDGRRVKKIGAQLGIEHRLLDTVDALTPELLELLSRGAVVKLLNLLVALANICMCILVVQKCRKIR